MLAIPFAFAAAPVFAQPASQPVQIPPELTDPAFIDRIARMSDALSKALVNLPVGEIQAATQAFAKALPAITKALSEAADEMERAAANMPRPDYPKR